MIIVSITETLMLTENENENGNSAARSVFNVLTPQPALLNGLIESTGPSDRSCRLCL